MELRVVGQHVAVNIQNPNRPWVHNFGPQQKSAFRPWTGALKGGLGSIRSVVLGHAQIGLKTMRTWNFLRQSRMGSDDKKDRSVGRRDSGWRNRGRGSATKGRGCSSSSSSSSPSPRKRRGKHQQVKEAQKFLEKHDPQYKQWKEEAKKKERSVEL